MSLLEIRKKFVEFSGRYDLVTDTTTYADNGADWFINVGQRYLDRCLDIGKVRARYFTTLKSGRHSISIPYARVIEEVWLINSEGRYKLIKETPNFMDGYYQAVRGEIVEAPQYFCPMVTRIAESSDLSSFPADYATVQYEDSEYSGIFFGVKSDVDYQIEIHGLFYSPKLLTDTSRSYWSEAQSEVLIAASLLSLERFYRNFEGLKESKASVMDLITQIDMDEVAQQIVDVHQMEG